MDRIYENIKAVTLKQTICALIDRIDEFKKDIKIPEHSENLLYRDGRYSYIYYDKKKQSLILQQFPI